MNKIDLPILGKGSQPPEEDGTRLEFMKMPQAMNTYQMPLVSIDIDTQTLQPARSLLERLLCELAIFPTRGGGATLPLAELDVGNRRFIDEMLGEGEVSVRFDGAQRFRIQETVLAGVWFLQKLSAGGEVDEEWLEVGEVPQLIRTQSFAGAAERIDTPFSKLPDGVMNAPPILTELNASIANYSANSKSHVINLSLLPQTEQDLVFLSRQLGIGSVTMLSRGYGNCRISSTATRFVWWVQYFNSEDTMILNTLEVNIVPEVARAATEDIEDSRGRLEAMLSAYL